MLMLLEPINLCVKTHVYHTGMSIEQQKYIYINNK